MKRILTVVSFAFVVCFAGQTFAADTFLDAIKESKPYADLRLRYEYVDQDGMQYNANAKTARLRLGFKTAEWNDFIGLVEGENVSYIGADDYNDTVNGRTTYPTVADPENVQVNQAWIQYGGVQDTTIKAGRQVFTLDGHRFVGHVGWRQNNQVYDAAVITNKSIEDTTLTYGYIYNVNRIFGEQSGAGDFESNSHVFHMANTSFPIGTITFHGYLFDFGSDSPANSNQTFAVSLKGKKELDNDIVLQYYGEYANQSDYADNTTDYTANYYHIAPAVVWKGLTTTVGFEVLGSDDGVKGFATPLATLHKWNGWADKFLATPATGLQD